MDDALAGGEPLEVAAAVTSCGAHGIGVIDEAAPHDRHRFEAAVRMLGKAGDDVAVIHAPAVDALEIHADVAAGERRCRAELGVSGRVGVVVVDAKEKRIARAPRKAERVNAEHDVFHLRFTRLGRARPPCGRRQSREHSQALEPRLGDPLELKYKSHFDARKISC